MAHPSQSIKAVDTWKGEEFLRNWHQGKFHSQRGRQDAGSSAYVGFQLCNGASYIGGMDDAKRPNGNGAYERTENGFRYKGGFSHGVVEGQGRMEFDGIVAEGVFKDGEFVKGTYRLPNGHTFTGVMHDGSWVGECRIQYANGDVYEGEVRSDLPHGKGRWTQASGTTFEGTFRQGKREGMGKLLLANGDVFEGMFVKGKIDGQGTLVTAAGNKLMGLWLDGKVNGGGRHECVNGVTYDGEFRNSIMHGKGTLACNEEVSEWGQLAAFTYHGGMANGAADGEGTLAMGTLEYTCSWKGGAPNGSGTLSEVGGKKGGVLKPLAVVKYDHGIRCDVFEERKDAGVDLASGSDAGKDSD